MSVIIQCLGGDWTPHLGDRGIQAWVTVLAYLACGFLAVAVWRNRQQKVLRRFWGFIAMLMLFLALNKQLDLQTALTETGRCLAWEQGWSDYRRFVQLLFILLVCVFVLLMLSQGLRMMRGYLASHWLALTGTALVGAYVLIRATSFHAVDLFSTAQLFGLSANFLLENAGLVLIALNAILLLNGRIVVIEKLPTARHRRLQPGGFSTSPPLSPAAPGDEAAGGQTEEHKRFRPLEPRGR